MGVGETFTVSDTGSVMSFSYPSTTYTVTVKGPAQLSSQSIKKHAFSLPHSAQ